MIKTRIYSGDYKKKKKIIITQKCAHDWGLIHVDHILILFNNVQFFSTLIVNIFI